MSNNLSITKFVSDNAEVIEKLKTADFTNAQIARYLLEENPEYKPHFNVDSVRKTISNLVSTKDAVIGIEGLEENKVVSDEKATITQNNNNADDDDDDSEYFSDDEVKNLSYNKRYYYDSNNDIYLFFLGGANPYHLTGTQVRDMKRLYSNMCGGSMTINQICRKMTVNRETFVRVKTILGWTHDGDPYTDEEMFAVDEDTLVNDALQLRKQSFFQKYTQKEFALIQSAANNWWAFQEGKLNPFMEKLIESEANIQSKPVEFVGKTEGDKYALVFAPYDFHFGKYAWEGEVGPGMAYNREIARKVLFEKTDEILADVVKHRIERVIIPVGSDFYHIDTLSGTTTKGTPQDVDGTWTQIMVEGNQLMIDFIDRVRAVCKNVEIIGCFGNHDFKLCHSLIELLGAYYRNEDGVTVHKYHTFKTYTTFGTSLIGFTHGDQIKHTDLPIQMAQERPREWADSKFKMFFTGHLHHEHIKDHKGVKVYQMPSLSGSDRWHHNNGWEGSVRGLSAYMVHETKGVKHVINAPIVEMTPHGHTK